MLPSVWFPLLFFKLIFRLSFLFHLFLTVLGLHGLVGLSLVAVVEGCPPVVVEALLIAVLLLLQSTGSRA